MKLESLLNPLTVTLVGQFAQLALNCITREYPHVHRYWLANAKDFVPPRQLTPAFYGCLDWHSAVHSHWTLVRAIRCCPDLSFEQEARAAITQNLTPQKIALEVNYLESQPRFECPYGLAWLLQLMAELTEWPDPQAQTWLAQLKPLETVAVHNLQTWMTGLTYPDRTGTHNQTAFALGLIWDWATVTCNQSVITQIQQLTQQFYYKDCNYPLYLEPLGYDFLSPSLAEADLMRRCFAPESFALWFTAFLPKVLDQKTLDQQALDQDELRWLQPVHIQNPEDYSQSHLEGLNLSRAWMLEGIINGLPEQDPRISTLQQTALIHRQAGFNPVSIHHYGGSHWLGSFAVYLITQRGLIPLKR
ncbi:MAG: DUF2891 domain-containing protein [Microcoleaceae cyanobacterium]